MNPQRPLAVLFVAILCLVAGGFGSCCNLVGVIAPVIEPVIDLAAADGTDPEAAPPQISLGKTWIELANWSLALLDLFLALILIVLGLGLLKLRRWARVLGLSMAVLLILSTAVNLVLTIHEMNAEQHQELGPLGSLLAGTFGFIASVASALFWLSVAIALLIVLLRPSISAAFSRKP